MASSTQGDESDVNCGFYALVEVALGFLSCILVVTRMGAPMKRIAFGTAIILALLSIAGCAQTGKGKAPPPVVTKG